MFGRRGATTGTPISQPRAPAPGAAPLSPAPPPPVSDPAPAASSAPPVMRDEPAPAAPAVAVKKAAPPPPPPPEPKAPNRSEGYYATKASIFNALVEAIDLSMLTRLSAEDAREEIRDVVNDIIALKNVVMSISEQEDLLEDICNDVLGYGPLEPLLARDDIADIMVNGASTVYIETEGKMQQTGVRFRDNKQLMNICQRIVSQVGRRVDESSPICDARLADGSRVNVIAPPLAIDGPVLTIRKFKKDKLTLDQLVTSSGRSRPKARRILQIIGRSPLQCGDFRRYGVRKDHPAELPDAPTSTRTERIITCEDAAELQLQQAARGPPRDPARRTWRASGQVTMRDLVRNCLRMRPERIIVGEVRGPGGVRPAPGHEYRP